MNRLSRSSVKARVLSSRLGSLLLLFQRSPVVQMLFPEARVLGGAGIGELAKWTVATVAGLGAYDTVAGATTVSQLSPNNTPGSTAVTAAVGSPLNFVVQCTGAPGTPGSWTMSTVPPGLTHSNSKNSSTDSLSGIPNTQGSYSIIAKCWENSNFSGGSSSKTFTMTVGPAVIATHPASVTINSGSSTTLTVVGSGSPLTYQWYQGASGVTTSPISGATSASYTTPNLAAAANYWVRVTRGTLSASANPVAANSTTAAVSVATTPIFSTQPTSTTINSGGTATLTVVASGATGFQWYIGAVGDTSNPIPGATLATYTTDPLTVTTSYWVRATNGSGFTNSAVATVTVNQPAAIATHPSSGTINSGNTTTLSVVASGTGPFTYQWYQGTSGTTTTPVGTNSSSFTTPVLTADRSYWVKVTNAANPSGALSNTAVISVNQPAAITTHPSSGTITSGNTTTLSVVASGTGPFTYQWYQGTSGTTTTPVGTNSSSFTTPILTADRSYWVKVTNAANSSGALSNTATITVNQILTITSPPASISIDSGTATTLSVTATGNNPLSYQWYEGTVGVTTIPVGTNSSFFTTPALTTGKTYWVRVTDTLGPLDSSAATVSINPVTPPVIATHPASITLNSGTSTTLTVSITGSTSSFQWYLGTKGDTSTPVGTNSSSFTTPTLTSTTSYWVKATNTAGIAESDTATVNVVIAPQITAPPASSTVVRGSSVSLSVVASGTSPTYQWLAATPTGSFNAIPNANSDTFSIASITGTTRFRVQVSNSAGSIDSAIATITVITAPTIATQPQSITIGSGSTTTLSVAINGSDSTYQWYRGLTNDTSNPVAEATLSTFTTPPLTTNTTYWVRATNLAGIADSDPAIVTVATLASITTHPASIRVNRDATPTLSVVATGTGPLSYQWYLGESGDITSPIEFATNDTFTIPALTGATSYWVRVSNPFSNADSQTAVISLNRFTVTTSGTQGTVTGAGTFDAGSTQSLTATPDSGYVFSGWSGDATGSTNPLQVTMDADKSITAIFSQDTADSDSDGLTNFQELVTHLTNPALADTDGDGLKDGQEILSTQTNPKLADSNANGTSDANEDPDADGLSNLDELNRFNTNPLLADSNSDGLSDAYAAAFVGTAIKPSVGNQISLNLRNLAAPGNTLKLVGKPPKGLTFNATTGLLSGIITAPAGTYPLSVQILSGKTVLKTISIPIVILPFPSSLIGSFESLVENNNSVPIGAFKITITAANAWSATLDSVGGASRKAKGTFVLAQGAPIAPITASFTANGSAPAMTFNVSLNGSQPTFNGTYNGGTIRGFKIASGSENPGSTTLCNLVLDPGAQNGDTVPAGLGSLKGSFSNLGVGTFKGMLGDGSAATVSVKLSTTGQAIIWSQPSKDKRTYLGGIITLGGIGQPANTSAKLTDRAQWAKAADAKALSYPNGFPSMPLTIGSSRWAVPSNATALGASLGWRSNRIASVSILGGGLSNSSPQATSSLLPTEFSLDDSFNLVTSLPTGSPLVAWSGKATNSDGGFTGTLTIPTGFSTAVLPGAAAASGVFVQDDFWGAVTGCGLVRVPVAGIKGSFKTAAFVIGQ